MKKPSSTYLRLLAFLLFTLPAVLTAGEKLTYECRYTSEPIIVDGKLDEAAWNKAPALNFYIPVTDEMPASFTIGKVLWNESYLYVGLKAFDRDIGGKFTERDSPTFKEDVLETFLKPHEEKDEFYNFEINVLGTVFDARQKKGMALKERVAWSCEGLTWKTSYRGTLNQPADEDEYWCLELAIPFSGLDVLEGTAPEEGDTWLFHLARYDYSAYLPDGEELSSTAHLTKVNFHHYPDWDYLKFVK